MIEVKPLTPTQENYTYLVIITNVNTGIRCILNTTLTIIQRLTTSTQDEIIYTLLRMLSMADTVLLTIEEAKELLEVLEPDITPEEYKTCVDVLLHRIFKESI